MPPETVQHGQPADATAPRVAADRPAPVAPPAPPPPRSPLLDAVLSATTPSSAEAGSRLRQFLDEPDPAKAAALWASFAPGGGGPPLRTKAQFLHRLSRDIAAIDALVTRQVNQVLHDERFQKLEASWRGLQYLVDSVGPDDDTKVKVLSATWRELSNDALNAFEFETSELFRKVYSDEFGMPGGEPFGVLLADYAVHLRPSAAHPFDDVAALAALAQTAAAAFAPLVAAAHPSLLGLDSFAQLERPLNLPATFDGPDFLKWRAFRASEDARFVGLLLPRVLAREPYPDDGSRADGFRFREFADGPDARNFLWGTPVYAFGSVLVRSFAECGWLADIRGVRRGEEGGGIVTGLPARSAPTDRRGLVASPPTDVVITDHLERALADLGFIPLCACKDTEFAAFYSTQSAQRPKAYDKPEATANARLSAMLQYILCASRFAHYLKVMARDKIGTFQEAAGLQDYLSDWVHKYVLDDADASVANKAQFPLRGADVQVRETPTSPKSFACTMHLRPHFQLDDLTASVKLVTELLPARAG